jgi:2-polyprenyl-3-methyl-5-hydroxy-6-metoxy-1,4-benzoquinol methylase
MSFDFNSLSMEFQRCPLCASTEDFDPLARIDRYWMGISTVACRECGMITTNPRPTEPALDEFYRDHYRQVYAKVAEPSLEYLRANGVDKRAAYTARFLATNAGLPPRPKVLDVGCAEGSILHALREAFPAMDCVGVEPNPKFGAFAREYAGCQVVADLAAAPERPYDLIIVNHVLEHVVDPAHFLEALRKRLGPQGRLFVDVPNAAAYTSIDDLHLAHLHHFTTHTLASVAGLVQLRAQLVEAHEPPRHPASIRALFVAGDGEAIRLPSEEDIEAQRRIRVIGAKEGWYRFRGSLPLRAVRHAIRLIFRQGS